MSDLFNTQLDLLKAVVPNAGGASQVAVTGTVTASGTVTGNQGAPNTVANSWPVEVTDGTNVLGTSSHPVRTDPTGTTTQPVSGTVTANAGTNLNTSALALDTSVNLLLKPASTLAAVTTVSTVSAVTAITNALPTGTNSIGQVTANAGTNLNTSALALDTSVNNLLKPASTLNAVTTVGTITNPVTVSQATAANLNATITGTVTSNQGTANSNTNGWPVKVTDGTNTVGLTSYGTTRYFNTSSVQGDIISGNNSSTSNLASGATFTGTSDNTQGFGAIQVCLFADQNCTVHVQQSTDNSNWDVDNSYTVFANSGDGRTFQSVAQFTRIKVTNTGGSTTTAFRLQTSLMGGFGAFPTALSQYGAMKVSINDTNTTVGVTQSGTWTVGTNLSATTTGMTRFRNTALSNTATSVKSSQGNLFYYHAYNTNTSDCFLQFYNVASGSVTVGTTTPDLTLAVPGNGGVLDGSFDSAPFSFATAITVAATTTITGGTAPSTGLLVNLGYV